MLLRLVFKITSIYNNESLKQISMKTEHFGITTLLDFPPSKGGEVDFKALEKLEIRHANVPFTISLRSVKMFSHTTHPSSLDRSDMLECHNELVVVSSGDRRCGKRMALIQFCLPAKRERARKDY
jgi:hypothetical protein